MFCVDSHIDDMLDLWMINPMRCRKTHHGLCGLSKGWGRKNAWATVPCFDPVPWVPWKKTQILFWKVLKFSTSKHVFFDQRAWQAPQCGGQIQAYLNCNRFLVTTDFARVKVFSSNILSLEFAVSCLPWTWWQDLLSALSSRAAITSMEA